MSKTPMENLERALLGVSPDARPGIRAAVAEDIRAACELAWEQGWISWSPNMKQENPYARKATP